MSSCFLGVFAAWRENSSPRTQDPPVIHFGVATSPSVKQGTARTSARRFARWTRPDRASTLNATAHPLARSLQHVPHPPAAAAIQAGTAGALGYLFAGPATSVRRAYGANEKLRVAGIGVGGKGSSDIEQDGALMDVVALCDIDDDRGETAGKTWPAAKTYFDYRKMFDQMGKEFDAVTVSTADHSHARRGSGHAIRQARLLSKAAHHTVAEARLLRELAAEHKVCTQMGNQGSALDGLRRAVELVQAGTLGAIREAHVWTNRPAQYWKQSPDIVARPKDEPPCRRGFTGKNGSARHRCDRMRGPSRPARRITRTTGAATGTSAPGRSVIWPAIPRTWRSAR